jgi:hypothetical protein
VNSNVSFDVSFVVGWDEKAGKTVQLEGIADEPMASELADLKRIYFQVITDGIER